MWPVGVRFACAAVASVVALGCGDDPARVTLAPIAHPCGQPTGVNAVRVTAYAASGELTRALGADESVDIEDFPVDTEQLGVEVVIGGGAIGAIGKTAPVAFGELATGTAIALFMAPPDGLCPTVAPMTEPRIAPLLARAGDGVLVIGGHNGAGRWLATAELYDPATSTFTAVDVPQVLGENGFAGTTLATLPDGRVVVSGGPQPVITIFDPATRRFGESVLVESRAFHTAISIGDNDVLLAGGCSLVANGMCNGIVRNSSRRYDVRDLGMANELGPILRIGRLGATIFDVGIQANGQRGFVIAGGTTGFDPSPLGADRITLGDSDATAITGAHAVAAALDGGAVLTAFSPAGGPPDGTASVIAPGLGAARAINPAPALAGVSLVGLEDGRVVGLGTGRDVVVHDPTTGRWETKTTGGLSAGVDPGPTASPSLIRLADGSVLVVGGTTLSRNAWIYRPSLVGPASGSITVVPAGGTTMVLTPPDPSTVTRTDGWQLTASDDIARALVGGPRTTNGSVGATLRVREGGAGLVARHLGPGQELVAELVPGAPARLVQRSAGMSRTVCTGKQIPELAGVGSVTARFEVSSSVARVALGDEELLSCDVDGGERGAWGVAAIGVGARVAVDTVTVAR